MLFFIQPGFDYSTTGKSCFTLVATVIFSIDLSDHLNLAINFVEETAWQMAYMAYKQAFISSIVSIKHLLFLTFFCHAKSRSIRSISFTSVAPGTLGS